jgi:tRNA (guanine-N7-)-methyltransferase
VRQRKVRHQEERLAAASRLTVPEPQLLRGRWAEHMQRQRDQVGQIVTAGSTSASAGSASTSAGERSFSGDIYFEPGCGRGHFLASKATDQTTDFFIGAEGRPSVLISALERTMRQGLTNILYIPEFMTDPTLYFASGELAGIYLLFCDPWPKARHAKRRLTHRRFLEAYRSILRSGGFIEFKTDDRELYAFTLEECRQIDLRIDYQTEDLHRSTLPAREYQTQYEQRFRLLGKAICCCRIEID